MTMKVIAPIVPFCVVLYFFCLLPDGATAVRLESYNVDLKSITVSGLSSGGAMSMQYHIAHSSELQGVGILAGLPYACALEGTSALVQCESFPEETNVTGILSYMDGLADLRKIDYPSNITGQNVFIFHGTIDHRVHPGNGKNIKEIYERLGANLKTVMTMEAAHGFPTSSYGGPCTVYSPETQYINNCSYHATFDTLNHLYNGSLAYPNGSEVITELIDYDQVEFGGGRFAGMDDFGFAYVPTNCSNGTETVCRLHVAFHGCQQYRGNVGDIYVRNVGYLEVAEVNNIIVLFPQAAASPPVNMFGCWDWWGYNDNEFLTKLGGQIRAVNRMVKRVAAFW